MKLDNQKVKSIAQKQNGEGTLPLTIPTPGTVLAAPENGAATAALALPQNKFFMVSDALRH